MDQQNNMHLITFKISAMAFKFENYCKREEIEVKMIPVPSSLSKSCGYSCRINKEDIEDIKKLCEEKNIKYSDIYKITEEDGPVSLINKQNDEQ